MKYKDYIARVDFDESSGLFHGEVINLRDVITFEGESVTELKKSFKDSIEDYLDFCFQRGEVPDTPYNGLMSIQIPIDKQKQLFNMAAKEGKDINTYILDVLSLKTA